MSYSVLWNNATVNVTIFLLIPAFRYLGYKPRSRINESYSHLSLCFDYLLRISFPVLLLFSLMCAFNTAYYWILFIHWLDPFCQFMSVTEFWNPGSCACWASALELSSIPALTILSLGLTMNLTLVLFLLCISTSASGLQSPRFIDVCFLLTCLCLIKVIGSKSVFSFYYYVILMS